jgi:hypothetical protein
MLSKKERFINKIYKSALAEHFEYKKISSFEIKKYIKDIITEIDKLDKSKANKIISLKKTSKINAVWVLSGPDTYNNQASSKRYQKYTWMKGMDKSRVDYGKSIIRNQTKINPNKKPKPFLIYNGNNKQNSVIKKLFGKDNNIIVQGKNIIYTYDQIYKFSLPKKLQKQRKEIVIVSHTPHLVRALHMANKKNNFPKNMEVRPFPIKVSKKIKEKYTSMEVQGLLYYTYLSKPIRATRESYPYITHD